MVQRICKVLKWLSRWGIVSALPFGIVMSFPTSTWAQSKGFHRARGFLGAQESREGLTPHRWKAFNAGDKESSQIRIARRRGPSAPAKGGLGGSGGTYERLSPEEKEKLQRKLKEWESLPPEKRRIMRERMERWKELTPEDRGLFRQRFQQWQKLSPEERGRIREKLEKWERLHPKEQEEIRQRFR